MTRYVDSKHGNRSNRKPKGKPAQLDEKKRIGRNKRPRNARRKCPSKSILNSVSFVVIQRWRALENFPRSVRLNGGIGCYRYGPGKNNGRPLVISVTQLVSVTVGEAKRRPDKVRAAIQKTIDKAIQKAAEKPPTVLLRPRPVSDARRSIPSRPHPEILTKSKAGSFSSISLKIFQKQSCKVAMSAHRQCVGQSAKNLI